MRYPADDPNDDPPYTNETYHQGIFRVLPGHYLEFDCGMKRETPYWTLDPTKPKLYYSDPRDYLKHFEFLLHEALVVTTQSASNLALEFSGGIDSSMLFLACIQLGIDPTLFTNVPPSYRQPTVEDANVASLVSQFNWGSKHVSVDAERFEPIPVFQEFSKVFCGPPVNLNCILSNNLHHSVIQRNHRFILSGHGGDDGVSLIFPVEMAANPEKVYEYEYDLLYNDFSHTTRMRLEYSALVAKSMGFRYLYPLLYPPLVEYCFLLPIEQKIKKGVTRCVAREYISQHVNNMNFDTKDGAVVPGPMQKCRDYYRSGKFSEYFVDLPFNKYIVSRISDDDKLLLQINAFMAKHGLPATQ